MTVPQFTPLACPVAVRLTAEFPNATLRRVQGTLIGSTQDVGVDYDVVRLASGGTIWVTSGEYRRL